VTVKASAAASYIDEKRPLIVKISDTIWEYAEVGLHEDLSAKCLEDALEAEGFKVDRAVAGMPTAFVATWGSGRPVIGYLGEYDALPGVSQAAIPTRQELKSGGAGHGCGHNLLGAGSFAAAVGLKRELEARHLPGTVKYFGCPAEENFSGKAFMARDGLFDDCDACLTWHAGSLNRVRNSSSLANNAMNVMFYGRTAHAAGDPYNGRSALDSLQLMNMGVEFLREHMSPSARVHYVITNGGDQPNVVPAKASAWYLVRAPRREEVDDLYKRVLNCAYGAAQMTDTRVETDLIKAIWNILPNGALEDLLEDCARRVGPPKFTEEDLAFAGQISKSFTPGQREAALRKEHVPEEVLSQVLNDTWVPRSEVPREGEGSTDVGDVSWCCPTAQFGTACNAIGTPGHSWQYTAQAGMEIGHKGMIVAGKILAEAGFELMTGPELLQKAKAEFKKSTRGKPYVSAIPKDHEPKFDQFERKGG
jgi:aminobenzoyl-glutamate utilization protein B